jgi:hypothetical protein
MIDYNKLAAQLADRENNPNQLIKDWGKLYFLTEPNFWNELLTAFQLIYNRTAGDLYKITDLNPHLKEDKALSRDRDLQSPLVSELKEKVAGLCKTTILKTSINELETGCNCDKCPLLLKIQERIKAEVLPEAKAQLSTLPPEFSRHFLEAEIRDALSQQREAKEAATKPGANLGGCSEMYVFNVERIQALRGVFAPPANDTTNGKAQRKNIKEALLTELLKHPPENDPGLTYKLVAAAVPMKGGTTRNPKDPSRRRAQFLSGEVTFKTSAITLIFNELNATGELKDHALAEAVKRYAT